MNRLCTFSYDLSDMFTDRLLVMVTPGILIVLRGRIAGINHGWLNLKQRFRLLSEKIIFSDLE